MIQMNINYTNVNVSNSSFRGLGGAAVVVEEGYHD